MYVCVGRTERRTDRILIARPRLHSMQRGKNEGLYWRQQRLEKIKQDMEIK